MEEFMNWNDVPHRRYNPLTGETVLVSPHRTKRPWQGKVEALPPNTMPRHDPSCYLCPGNTRAGGEVNPSYTDVFSFTNDFSALLTDVPTGSRNDGGLLVADAESGLCRVLCYSPEHNLTLARMSDPALTKVVDEWARQFQELGSRPDIGHVQIFENRGEIMGSSMPHPHGQIWAQRTVPDLPSREGERQGQWKKEKGTVLLLDYLALEQKENERILFENDTWVALVPFWAVWPFETMLLPKAHRRDLLELTAQERADLGNALGRMARRYDNLFQVSFPYTMGLHQRPTDGQAHDGWQLHAHFLPPLLRSATVRKFMVGYELLAQAQRDITAEQAAERLRACSEEVFK
jgi:UDPglucose--hexose-1-phosphate uridylyltransferase